MAAEICMCRGCVPTSSPTVCSRCGEEVRVGYRGGEHGWWHRGDAGHHAILGHMLTVADFAEIERQRKIVRHLDDGTPYTVESYEISKIKDRAAREAAEQEQDDEWEPDELPEPEVRATPIDVGDDRLPRGAKTHINRARKAGWTVTATYARGPVAHGTTGKLLRVVDSVVVRARLAEGPRVAVACWRTDAKGKYTFASAWIGTIRPEEKTIYTESANADVLKMWIEGEEPE